MSKRIDKQMRLVNWTKNNHYWKFFINKDHIFSGKTFWNTWTYGAMLLEILLPMMEKYLSKLTLRNLIFVWINFRRFCEFFLQNLLLFYPRKIFVEVFSTVSILKLFLLFNPLMSGDNKKLTHTLTNFCLSMCGLFVTTWH